MTCYYPRKAFPIEGGIAFEKPRDHSGRIIKIPCKRCTGCRLDHRTNWSTRMMHEASLYESNQFVTLTYDNEHLPKNGDLDQVHMQKFFKRLRKEFSPNKLRYVYSSEYGTDKSRPHYHAIIFGLDLPDLVVKDTNDRGEPLYASAILDRIWQNGQTTTGQVTEQSCAYVAGYMLKDIKGDYINQYETVDVETGEVTPRKRPFARYSNRPGIGKGWFDKYKDSVFPQDVVRIYKPGEGCHTVPVPSYYFDLLEKTDPAMHAEVKAKREAAIYEPRNRWNSSPDRLKVRETCKLAKISLSGRGTKQDGQKTIYMRGTE